MKRGNDVTPDVGTAKPSDVFICARNVTRYHRLPHRHPAAARRPPGNPPGTAGNPKAKTHASVIM